MLLTPQSIALLIPRSYPYYLIEDGSTGFAVKVQKTGSTTFYYRKKANGKRVDIPLGKDLKLARLKYIALQSKEEDQRERQEAETLRHALGIHHPHQAHSGSTSFIANPLYYSGIDFQSLSSRFIAEHVQPNLKPKTATDYKGVIVRIQHDFHGSHLLNGNISVDEARLQLKTYIHRLGQKTPVMANRLKAALSSMFKWGVYEDMCYSSPIYGIRAFRERPKTKRFTQNELPAFYKVLNDGDFGWRTVSCLQLILASGLRASEALNIRPENIDWQTNTLVIPTNKSGRPFIVPLTPLTTRLLKIASQDIPQGDKLFRTSVYGLRQVCT